MIVNVSVFTHVAFIFTIAITISFKEFQGFIHVATLLVSVYICLKITSAREMAELSFQAHPCCLPRKRMCSVCISVSP